MNDDREQIPDAVLLARGHRWARAARLLALPAKIFAVLSLALLALVLSFAIDLLLLAGAAIWIVLASALVWTIRRRRDQRPRSPPPLHERGLANLLDTGDFLIDRLERGEDHDFNWYVFYFARALDGLTPDERKELDLRGADLEALRVGLYSADDKLRDPTVERRTLHHALLRFVAAGRQPVNKMPYRSGPTDEPDSLRPRESRADLELRRALRVRLGAIGSVVTLIWIGIAGGHIYDRLDSPAVYLVVTTMPLFMLLAAHVTRNAAQRSWTAARPLTAAGVRQAVTVAATVLSWTPVLSWIVFAAIFENTWSDVPDVVWGVGVFTVGPVIADAILERRADALTKGTGPKTVARARRP